MISPPPAAATSTRASKAGIVRTIEPCCSSAIHHAWRLHSRLHLGRKCRLEKVALVVRRSEAAGWRWSSSTLNECKPRFLGVDVMHWARPMAAELRDTRSGRRKGSSSDISSVREKARIELLRKGSSWDLKNCKGKPEQHEPSFGLFAIATRGRAARQSSTATPAPACAALPSLLRSAGRPRSGRPQSEISEPAQPS